MKPWWVRNALTYTCPSLLTYLSHRQRVSRAQQLTDSTGHYWLICLSVCCSYSPAVILVRVSRRLGQTRARKLNAALNIDVLSRRQQTKPE